MCRLKYPTLAKDPIKHSVLFAALVVRLQFEHADEIDDGFSLLTQLNCRQFEMTTLKNPNTRVHVLPVPLVHMHAQQLGSSSRDEKHSSGEFAEATAAPRPMAEPYKSFHALLSRLLTLDAFQSRIGLANSEARSHTGSTATCRRALRAL